MLDTSKSLSDQYLRILQNSKEFQKIWQSSYEELSGLFLAGVPENYYASHNKIMIVGRETRGWGKQYNSDCSLQEYIQLQEQKAHDYLSIKKDKQRNERGSSFHNFLSQVSKKGSQTAVVWANLNCYSWKRSRSDKSPLANEIDVLSHELLKAQIEILRPQYLILAHGVARYSIELRQKLLPNIDCVTLKEPELESVGDRQIWKFQYPWAPDYKVTCFRIQHPSSISKLSRLARGRLLEHLDKILL